MLLPPHSEFPGGRFSGSSKRSFSFPVSVQRTRRLFWTFGTIQGEFLTRAIQVAGLFLSQRYHYSLRGWNASLNREFTAPVKASCLGRGDRAHQSGSASASESLPAPPRKTQRGGDGAPQFWKGIGTGDFSHSQGNGVASDDCTLISPLTVVI